MSRPFSRPGPTSRLLAASLALAALAAGLVSPTPVRGQSTPEAVAPARPAPSRDGLAWTFDASSSAAGSAWTAERGRMTLGKAEAELQPDANRRVVLLSPPALPESAREAEEFLLQVAGTGLQRVRILARRDARGGWITIADASGAALRQTTDGYLVKRKPGSRSAPIERLRIELEFRTTNPRALTRIAVVPARG